MEELVKAALRKYRDYVSDVKMLERCTDFYPDRRSASAALELAKMRKTTVEAWLNLLTEDELFVVQKHLMEGLEWPRVAFAFKERWKHVFFRTERSLGTYQASAIRKIATFARKHQEITISLFSQESEQTPAAQ